MNFILFFPFSFLFYLELEVSMKSWLYCHKHVTCHITLSLSLSQDHVVMRERCRMLEFKIVDSKYFLFSVFILFSFLLFLFGNLGLGLK